MFDSTTRSPWKPVSLKIRVYNPHKKNKTPVSFNIRDVPKNWAVEIKPMRMTLPAGGSRWVKFGVYPSGAPGSEESSDYQPGYLGKPIIEALVPYADTFIPIGGVEAWTNLLLIPHVDKNVQCDPRDQYDHILEARDAQNMSDLSGDEIKPKSEITASEREKNQNEVGGISKSRSQRSHGSRSGANRRKVKNWSPEHASGENPNKFKCEHCGHENSDPSKIVAHREELHRDKTLSKH